MNTSPNVCPLLFNIFLEITISMALHEIDAGVVISGHVVNCLRFADNIAAVAEMNANCRQW